MMIIRDHKECFSSQETSNHNNKNGIGKIVFLNSFIEKKRMICGKTSTVKCEVYVVLKLKVQRNFQLQSREFIRGIMLQLVVQISYPPKPHDFIKGQNKFFALHYLQILTNCP